MAIFFDFLRFSQTSYFSRIFAVFQVSKQVSKHGLGVKMVSKFSEYFSTKNKVAQAANLRPLCDLILFLLCAIGARKRAVAWKGGQSAASNIGT